MRRRVATFAMGWLALTSISAAAETAYTPRPSSQSPGSRPIERKALPRSELNFFLGLSVLEADTGLPEPELLAAIGRWITSNFDLPPAHKPSNVALMPTERMITMRMRAVMQDYGAQAAAESHAASPLPDIVALYDDRSGTIYLPESWLGGTPAEDSILVHEMVHHLQNQAMLRFECPEAREKQAFEAQERWLSIFGTSLEEEFGIDPFTLLVRTNCFY